MFTVTPCNIKYTNIKWVYTRVNTKMDFEDDERNLALKIVNKLLRKQVTGGHKKQVDTVKKWVASHNEKQAEEMIRRMIKDPDAPLEGYGGSRDNVRLTSIQAGKDFVEEHGGNPPFGV